MKTHIFLCTLLFLSKNPNPTSAFKLCHYVDQEYFFDQHTLVSCNQTQNAIYAKTHIKKTQMLPYQFPRYIQNITPRPVPLTFQQPSNIPTMQLQQYTQYQPRDSDSLTVATIQNKHHRHNNENLAKASFISDILKTPDIAQIITNPASENFILFLKQRFQQTDATHNMNLTFIQSVADTLSQQFHQIPRYTNQDRDTKMLHATIGLIALYLIRRVLRRKSTLRKLYPELPASAINRLRKQTKTSNTHTLGLILQLQNPPQIANSIVSATILNIITLTNTLVAQYRKLSTFYDPHNTKNTINKLEDQLWHITQEITR